MSESLFSSHHGAPHASPASSLPSNIPGRMISRGNCFPGSPPSRVLTRHPYVVRMLYLAYINTCLLVRSKRVTTEICEIKSEKNTTPAGRQPRSIPLNAARKGRDLGWQCPIFERSIARSAGLSWHPVLRKPGVLGAIPHRITWFLEVPRCRNPITRRPTLPRRLPPIKKFLGG